MGEGNIMLVQIKGHSLPQRGDNSEIAKIDWHHLKIHSTITGLFQPNLTQSILGWRGLIFVQIKRQACYFSGGDNSKNSDI